jgi:hypothetical protein
VDRPQQRPWIRLKKQLEARWRQVLFGESRRVYA